MRDAPTAAFAYFLIDPKGWRIPLVKLKPMLERRSSEMTFNYMSEFINRAANIDDPVVINGLDELMPSGWKQKLEEERGKYFWPVTPERRKQLLVGSFKESLQQLGGYKYIAETPIHRPVKDHTLYYLLHATRHKEGLKAFRGCQVKALATQAETRGVGKVKHLTAKKGQSELFGSMHDMGPDRIDPKLDQHRMDAEATILAITPRAPAACVRAPEQ